MTTSSNDSEKWPKSDIIDSWHERAQAYDKLIKRWPIFTKMADRLIDSIPADTATAFHGRVLDIGGGSGLVSERFLRRHPNAKMTLIDPAEEMCRLVKARFGDRVIVQNESSDQLHHLNIAADGAVCSAAFHLMDEQAALPSIAAVLEPGSIFAFNLWGHSFDETAQRDQRVDWSAFVNQALSEYGEPLLPQAKKGERRPRSLDTLIQIGKDCGLVFQKKEVIEERLDAKFHIEFAAMSPKWLTHVEPKKREQITNRASEIAIGVSTIFYVSFSFINQ